MVRIASVMLLLTTSSCVPAQGQVGAQGEAAHAAHRAEDPVPDTRRVADELEALERSPVGQAVERLRTEMKQLDAQSEEKQGALRKRREQLYESAEYEVYAAKQDELQAKLGERWAVERTAFAKAAEQIYGERHAELRKLGAPKLTAARALGIDVLTYPRVGGSTSTHPLSVIVASRVLGVGHEWVYPGLRGRPWLRASKADDRFFLPGTEPEESEDDEFQLAASFVIAKPSDPASPGEARLATMVNSLLALNSGTHDSLVNLVEGKCDLVFTVRGPSASERALAAERGVEIELTPVAKDALVVIVNRRNPVKGLTSAQVRGIFKGEFKRWAELGVVVEDNGVGFDEREAIKNKIVAFTRERDSGSRELFDALVMREAGGAPAAAKDEEDGDALIGYGMGGPFNLLTLAEDGISYTVRYYEHFMAASPLTRTIAVDGVEPNAETIASGKYPHVVPVYVARRRGEPADSPASRLLNWLVSAEGQAVVRESGYVPVK